MEELKGIICECCGKEFQKDDQVAYCPVCGAPVHLSCWKEKGGCPFEEKHSEGFVYQIPAQSGVSAQSGENRRDIGVTGNMSSSDGERDSAENNTDGDGFNSQGDPVQRLKQLLENTDSVEQYESTDSTEYREKKYDGVSEQEIAHFLNIDHPNKIYRFLMIKYMIENKRKVSLNFFAGILNPFNQFYKGMTVLGLLLTLFNCIMELPQIIIYFLTMLNENGAEIASALNQTALLSSATVLGMLQFAVKILLCLFGDYLYISFMLKKIKSIRARFSDDQSEEYMTALSYAGRPRPGLVVVGILLYTLITLLEFALLSKMEF